MVASVVVGLLAAVSATLKLLPYLQDPEHEQSSKARIALVLFLFGLSWLFLLRGLWLALRLRARPAKHWPAGG